MKAEVKTTAVHARHRSLWAAWLCDGVWEGQLGAPCLSWRRGDARGGGGQSGGSHGFAMLLQRMQCIACRRPRGLVHQTATWRGGELVQAVEAAMVQQHSCCMLDTVPCMPMRKHACMRSNETAVQASPCTLLQLVVPGWRARKGVRGAGKGILRNTAATAGQHNQWLILQATILYCRRWRN
jgi:hypothetical protein